MVAATCRTAGVWQHQRESFARADEMTRHLPSNDHFRGRAQTCSTLSLLLGIDDGVHCAARSGWCIISGLDKIAGRFALLSLLLEHEALGQVWPEVLRKILLYVTNRKLAGWPWLGS